MNIIIWHFTLSILHLQFFKVEKLYPFSRQKHCNWQSLRYMLVIRSVTASKTIMCKKTKYANLLNLSVLINEILLNYILCLLEN